MNILRSQPGLLNGPHVAPIPVAPSDDLKKLSDDLTRMRREKNLYETNYKLSQEKLDEANARIAVLEAQTPSKLLVEVVQWVAFVFYY